VEPAMKHLAEEVQVPAVIGTLKPGDLLRSYEAYAKRDIFYLSPVSVTTSVIDEDDDGRIWNLLGQPSDFAPTYAALLERSEAWLREDRELAESAHLKVVLVTTGDAFDAELRDSLLPTLRFNELSLTDNGEDFMGVELDGSAEDLAEKALEIAQFAPDIIISAASELFVMSNGVQELVEYEWGVNAGGHPRPFYILSPYNAGDVNGLLSRISGRLADDPTAGEDQQRYVGVSIAPAADLSLQNAYGVRLRSKFKSAIVDTANYYDAIYYLAYAMYGAGEPEGLTGTGITRGMQRLFAGDSYKIGPTTSSATFKALSVEDATIHLASTLGPPEFDPKTGVRPIDGGVFCFKAIGTTAKLVPDVLRYNRESKTFTGDFSSCNADF
jgi:ABC-type branched-subunit amino acid transport system substrate-binding protein